MKEEKERRQRPVVDTGNEQVNRSVVKTQRQWEDELEKGARRISSSVVVPAVKKAISEFDKRADEVVGKHLQGVGSYVPGGIDVSALYATRAGNEARDPEKILSSI